MLLVALNILVYVSVYVRNYIHSYILYAAFQSQCYITRIKNEESLTHDNDNVKRRRMLNKN